MARQHNFLLGRGEALTTPVEIKRGGGTKRPPYSFPEARKYVSKELHHAVEQINALPDAACPGERAVAVLTMHPRYAAKSDYPIELLNAAGLDVVGSKLSTIKPRKWGTKDEPEQGTAEELFVAAPRAAFRKWARSIDTWQPSSPGAAHLQHLEGLRVPSTTEKVRLADEPGTTEMLEVVLHNAGMRDVVPSFAEFATARGARVLSKRARKIGGLTFVPVRASAKLAPALAEFSLVRVARSMPGLRPIQSLGLTRSRSPGTVKMPSEPALNPDVHALVLDGGLPEAWRKRLAPWVSYSEATGIGPATDAGLQHGLAVTGVVLFGAADPALPLERPVCHVRHVRVIDVRDGANKDVEYLAVLDRILEAIETHGNEVEFINLSLGPDLPVDDDEITSWTAAIDEQIARRKLVMTVAVGNSGDRDPAGAAKMNRIQPPSDAVNVLAVGAADVVHRTSWRRAPYSSIGPGRSPGFIKPAGVAFGGSDGSPIHLLSPSAVQLVPSGGGTSFASPLVMRSTAGLRVSTGSGVSSLALMALMVHRADPRDHDRNEVGWGRFELDPDQLMTCEDHEVVVLYQGELPVKQHLRAPIPLPVGALRGGVTLTATLVIRPNTDPELPSVYTRSGVEVFFRPNGEKFNEKDDGSSSAHAATKGFFTATNMYLPEYRLRAEAHKWEPCLRHTQDFRATTLIKPCFDIYYHSRERGRAVDDPKPIPYALVVGLHAKKTKNLYAQVVRAYQNVLVPIKPQLRIRLRA